MRKRDNMAYIPENIDSISPEPIKRSWFQIRIYRLRRFVRLIKVAFHKSYMMKAILTTRCPACKRLFSFPVIREQNTRYPDEYDNYFCGCKICQELNDSYWQGMWEDYYSKCF